MEGLPQEVIVFILGFLDDVRDITSVEQGTILLQLLHHHHEPLSATMKIIITPLIDSHSNYIIYSIFCIISIIITTRLQFVRNCEIFAPIPFGRVSVVTPMYRFIFTSVSSQL